MNNRNPKAVEIARRIQGLAFAVPSSIADVFVEWLPHCHLFTVRAYEGGWRANADPSVKQSVYIDGDGAHEQMLEILNGLAAYLKGLGCNVVEPDAPAAAIHEATVSPDLRRETLAGMALQGILTYEGRPNGAAEDIAAQSVKIADALLAELAKPRA